MRHVLGHVAPGRPVAVQPTALGPVVLRPVVVVILSCSGPFVALGAAGPRRPHVLWLVFFFLLLADSFPFTRTCCFQAIVMKKEFCNDSRGRNRQLT